MDDEKSPKENKKTDVKLRRRQLLKNLVNLGVAAGSYKTVDTALQGFASISDDNRHCAAAGAAATGLYTVNEVIRDYTQEKAVASGALAASDKEETFNRRDMLRKAASATAGIGTYSATDRILKKNTNLSGDVRRCIAAPLAAGAATYVHDSIAVDKKPSRER